MLLLKVALKSRYRISLKNAPQHLSSTLILPNHPAEIDPVIMVGMLWNAAQPRPTVTEPIFKMPGLYQIFNLIKAFPMADMEQGSGSYKRLKIKRTLEQIKNALVDGDNILFYPSGRLSLDGSERLLGASGAYRIIQETSEAKILLVRIKGLWGSRFSKSHTQGVRPDIPKTFLSSLTTLIKNLVLFVPKRDVEIYFKEIKRSEIVNMSNREFNEFLEDFYNRDEIDKLALVPNSFLSNESVLPVTLSQEKRKEVSLSTFKKRSVSSYLSKISEKNIPLDADSFELGKDCGLDSLQIAELVIWLEHEHDVHEVELKDLRTIGDVYEAIASQKNATSHEAKKIPHWTDARRALTQPTSKTLTHAIMSSLRKSPSQICLHDDMTGALTNRRVLVASLLLSKKFTSLSGKYVGILLPASGAALITIVSLLFAKKVPVLLNWTAGDKNLQEAISSLSISTIISSGNILDRVNLNLEPIQDRLVLLDEMQQNISLTEKIICSLQSFLPLHSLEHLLSLQRTSENDHAAVLFTSGSESTPKAVPLTHKNILTNIKGIYEAFTPSKDDVILGFLPPFHSFGLTVTTLMPPVLGMRVAFSPNPNEASKLAKKIADFSVTLIAGTPTFLKQIFSTGEASLFNTLRLIVSGAEKLPHELREKFEHMLPQAEILEGYGITECSPVVAAQKIGMEKIGVGFPFPYVSIKIVNKESFAETDTEGLILVSGDTVFHGYLNTEQNPFINVDGISWYNTGDLGYFNQGSLIISGRLKRFMKVAGEMISLPAIEEALIKDLNLSAQSIVLIDFINPETKKAEIVCFTTQSHISKQIIQEKILSLGFPPIAKIYEVKHLPEIPVLGSGKTDIQRLKSLTERVDN